jgi:hypothetical protein
MKIIGYVILLALISGCASMVVREDTLKAPDKLAKPEVIYVKTFEPGDSWEGDFGTRSKEEYKRYEMTRLDERLLANLAEVAPTKAAPVPLPKSGLLVTGRLTHVIAGAGATRYWIGEFGQGAREVVGRVIIYDLAVSPTVPVVSYEMEGGSRAEGGILGAVDDLNADWDRIARETRNLLLEKMNRK